MGKKKKFNTKRHIVAVLALPVLLSYLYFLPPMPYFMLLILLLSMIAIWEFCAMYKVPARMYVPAVAAGGILLYVSCIYPAYFIHALMSAIFILLTLRLLFDREPSGCMNGIGPVFTSLVYVAGFMSFQWFLRTGNNGLEYIFLLYVTVWLSDSMAYYVGSYMGKHKLYPTISPNKTVEGAVGSVLGGIMGAVLMKAVFSIDTLPYMSAALTGAVLGFTSMIGDLIESMFKRDAGIKDSSNIIPGHGGILDKLDGQLVCGPVLYFLVRHF
ncbi:MAG: phosphatidate cytidylyltransferase [Nitrospira sp.]|nr:phosphatidate cytidylyltransferase [Nitrospira sp.]